MPISTNVSKVTRAAGLLFNDEADYVWPILKRGGADQTKSLVAACRLLKRELDGGATAREIQALGDVLPKPDDKEWELLRNGGFESGRRE